MKAPNMDSLYPPSARQRQSGAALVVGLIFLVVLTMIGVTAARMSSLEERMSGNLRDRAVALQAAEMALRDAERDINNSVPDHARDINGLSEFSADCGSATADTDDNGLCYNGIGGYGDPDWYEDYMTAASSVAYGTYTNADEVPLVSAQPRYNIEGMRKTPPGESDKFYYRITVRAQGINANTVVWLQELFTP
jgi:type IV pilus assembly protein PilX